MWLPFNARIWFYQQPIDFRKQIDGLVILVADTLQKDPTSGQLFVFRNRQADKLKMLYWQDDGFWLLYKRLETSRFRFPAVMTASMELTTQQLQWLLSGLELAEYEPKKQANYRHFY